MPVSEKMTCAIRFYCHYSDTYFAKFYLLIETGAVHILNMISVLRLPFMGHESEYSASLMNYEGLRGAHKHVFESTDSIQ